MAAGKTFQPLPRLSAASALAGFASVGPFPRNLDRRRVLLAPMPVFFDFWGSDT